VLFTYSLQNLRPSKKVKVVNILHGKGSKGLVKKCSGEWLSNQVFIVPVGKEKLFEQFFLRFNVKYKKIYILMH
jgi:hypothetical protein